MSIHNNKGINLPFANNKRVNKPSAHGPRIPSLHWRMCLFFIGLLMLSSCSKEEIATYDNSVAGIYFQSTTATSNDGSATYTDSVSFSFASVDATKKSIARVATIKVLGKLANYDRAVALIVDTAHTTARRGFHFDLRTDSVFVRAGQASVDVPITFYRTDDLLRNTYRLQLRLQANDQFQLVPDSLNNSSIWSSSTNVKLPGNTFTFIFSEKYTRPNYWEWFCDEFFGSWTAAKYLFVNSTMGWSVSDWNVAGSVGAKVAYGRLDYAARKVRDALQALADAGTPKKEESGAYMQLPYPYQVDYSANKANELAGSKQVKKYTDRNVNE